MLSEIKAASRALFGDRRGVTAVEYAVIAGTIVIAIAAAFAALGTTLTNFFTNLSF